MFCEAKSHRSHGRTTSVGAVLGGTVAGRCAMNRTVARRVSGAFVLRSSLPGGAPVNSLRDFIRALAFCNKTTCSAPQRQDGRTVSG